MAFGIPQRVASLVFLVIISYFAWIHLLVPFRRVPVHDIVESTIPASEVQQPTEISPNLEPGEEPERYIFAFGDSYTSNAFNWTLDKPSREHPLGNPAVSITSSNGPNWLDDVLADGPPNTLCYNWATGGAVVDVTIVRPPLGMIPFPEQVQNFTNHVATEPRQPFAPWTSANSIAIIWFGVNDVLAIQVYTDKSTPTELVDRIMVSYFTLVEDLHAAGLDKFIIMGLPPLFRAPFAWAPDYESLSNLTSSCQIWNTALEAAALKFDEEHADLKLDVVPVTSWFDEVLNEPDKYGSPDALCSQKRDDDNCLWVDDLHPGIHIARRVGDGMLNYLTNFGFFGG